MNRSRSHRRSPLLSLVACWLGGCFVSFSPSGPRVSTNDAGIAGFSDHDGGTQHSSSVGDGGAAELADAGRTLGPECTCLGLQNCCCTPYEPCSSWTPNDGAKR